MRSDHPISRHPSASQDEIHIMRRPRRVSRRAGVKPRPPPLRRIQLKTLSSSSRRHHLETRPLRLQT
eukprot:192519-Prymnesium_polylepis.1